MTLFGEKMTDATNFTLLRTMPQRLTSVSGIKWLLLAVLILGFLLHIMTTEQRPHLSKKDLQLTDEQQTSFLDGCRFVYIDMGTNIGIQIRKLYEPNLYPGASVLSLFKKVFRNYTNEVCSVGFEANPLHSDYLKEFERYCLQRKWRVKIFTATAVSVTQQNVTFFTQPGNERNNQWGASLQKTSFRHKGNVTIPSIDIISWFKKSVLSRKLPSGNQTTRIMMKTDIEGHDAVVLTNFILSGCYCAIDLIYGEHMSRKLLDAVSLVQESANSCKTELLYLDDESYHNRRFPFRA